MTAKPPPGMKLMLASSTHRDERGIVKLIAEFYVRPVEQVKLVHDDAALNTWGVYLLKSDDGAGTQDWKLMEPRVRYYPKRKYAYVFGVLEKVEAIP